MIVEQLTEQFPKFVQYAAMLTEKFEHNCSINNLKGTTRDKFSSLLNPMWGSSPQESLFYLKKVYNYSIHGIDGSVSFHVTHQQKLITIVEVISVW